MDVTEMSLYRVLGILFTSQVCSACISVECLRCNITDDNHTAVCFNDVPENCTRKDFRVSLNASDGFDLDEGEYITMNCTHNLPMQAVPPLHLQFMWEKDAHVLEGSNGSSLTLKAFSSDKGQYTCSIQSLCGNFTSLPREVTVASDSSVILIICGLSAVVLVVCLGLAMKYKLKKETAQNKRRKLQLQRNQQRGPEMRPRDA